MDGEDNNTAHDERPRPQARSVRSTKIILVAGLICGSAAIAVTLSQAPITVAGVNTAETRSLGKAHRRTVVCQRHETLPRETSAIRLRVFAYTGPRVTVAVTARGQPIARGEHESGWTSGVVTVPVKPLVTARSEVELCFTLFLNGNEKAWFVGERTKRAPATRDHTTTLPGRVRVEYLRPGRSSWWSQALSVARRMGLGHAGSGTWSVLLVIILMVSVVFLCSRLILREL